METDIVLQLETEPERRVIGIKAHRAMLFNTPASMSDAEVSVKIIQEARNIADDSGIDMYAFGMLYIYNEQYIYIKGNLVKILGTAVGVCFVILSFLLVSVAHPFCCCITIGSSITCSIAFLVWLGLSLNGITLLSIVFGISINVELCVHICRAFDDATGTKTERAIAALGEMGAPVFCGAMTTFLSVVVLAFSDTAFFRNYFFNFYSCMIAISLFFAWTTLPVLLSIFGPGTVTSKDRDLGGESDVPVVTGKDLVAKFKQAEGEHDKVDPECVTPQSMPDAQNAPDIMDRNGRQSTYNPPYDSRASQSPAGNVHIHVESPKPAWNTPEPAAHEI